MTSACSGQRCAPPLMLGVSPAEALQMTVSLERSAMQGLGVSSPAPSSRWSAVGAPLGSNRATCGQLLIAEGPGRVQRASRRAGRPDVARAPTEPTRACGPCG